MGSTWASFWLLLAASPSGAAPPDAAPRALPRAAVPCPLLPKPGPAVAELHAYHWDASFNGDDPVDKAYLNNTPGDWRHYDWARLTVLDVFSNGTIPRDLLCAAHQHGVRPPLPTPSLHGQPTLQLPPAALPGGTVAFQQHPVSTAVMSTQRSRARTCTFY